MCEWGQATKTLGGNEDNWYNTMATERILRGAGKK